LDKHSKAHSDIQQAMRELIEAVELLEGLVPKDDLTRMSLGRKLSQARQHLHDAHMDMRMSRLGEPGVYTRRLGD
jgi:hypothetical protein